MTQNTGKSPRRARGFVVKVSFFLRGRGPSSPVIGGGSIGLTKSTGFFRGGGWEFPLIPNVHGMFCLIQSRPVGTGAVGQKGGGEVRSSRRCNPHSNNCGPQPLHSPHPSPPGDDTRWDGSASPSHLVMTPRSPVQGSAQPCTGMPRTPSSSSIPSTKPPASSVGAVH